MCSLKAEHGTTYIGLVVTVRSSAYLNSRTAGHVVMTIHCGEFCEQLLIHFKLHLNRTLFYMKTYTPYSPRLAIETSARKTLQTKAAEMNETHIFSACV